MASETLHVPREKLSPKTLQLHYAISSLMEELEAVVAQAPQMFPTPSE